jgi:hypothetical protein
VNLLALGLYTSLLDAARRGAGLREAFAGADAAGVLRALAGRGGCDEEVRAAAQRALEELDALARSSGGGGSGGAVALASSSGGGGGGGGGFAYSSGAAVYGRAAAAVAAPGGGAAPDAAAAGRPRGRS